MVLKNIKTILIAAALISPAHAEVDARSWQYCATLDLSYANAFQTDAKTAWRSKATSVRLNEFTPNMGMAYLRKTVSDTSRWGMEIGAQGGTDTDTLFPATDRLGGYDVLRYLSRANASYLTPIGNGLLLTAGLMNSFIGFESLFAKDNPNYTRSWIADYSPYYLIGVGGQYPITPQMTASFFLVNDYDYLAYRNNAPKYAGQWAWNINSDWKLTQNLFTGPEQRNTATDYWRYFSDSILQWSKQDMTVALAYDVGTEQLVDTHQQVLWMGSALFTRWHIAGSWSVALRPEIYWDKDGRLTGNQQLLKAITATVEYKIPLDAVSVALRGEYRHDDSTGSQGGFFRMSNNDIDRIAGQDLVFFSCLLAWNRL
jgi:hypothetical protein